MGALYFLLKRNLCLGLGDFLAVIHCVHTQWMNKQQMFHGEMKEIY